MELGLTGKFAEVLQPVELMVTGAVPAWLTAAHLFRDGPGQFDVELDGNKGTFTVPHWFDGLTQVHAFHINDGKVTYRSRHLYPALEDHIRKHGTYATFAGIDPCQGMFRALFSKLLRTVKLAPPSGPIDPATGKPVMNVGVTIGKVADKLYSKTDANALVEVDAASLLPHPPSSYTDINPAFKGYLSAAHGQRDEARREYYNFTMDVAAGRSLHGVYHLFAIPDSQLAAPISQPTPGSQTAPSSQDAPGSKAQGHVLASIPADPAYIHSFAMTEKYLVFMVWPLLYNPLKLAFFETPGMAMTWRPDKPTMFYVVDKRKGGGGHVASFEADAFFCFHTINAWEEGGDLHIDLCSYDDGFSWFDAFRLPHLRSGKAVMPQVDIRRYSLPDIAAAIAAGPSSVRAAQKTVLASSSTPGGARTFELPRINKAVAMKPYQYVYAAAAASRESPFNDAIAKVDVVSGATQMWRKLGHFPGEPIFVGRPGGEREDDGLLLSVVLAVPD